MKAANLFLLMIHSFLICHLAAQSSDSLDVLHYHVTLEPNISEQYIEGKVSIQFMVSKGAKWVVFDSGNLFVNRITGSQVKGYEQNNNTVTIYLADDEQLDIDTFEIQLFYSGKPERGLVFLSNFQKAYTVFFTSDWMICNDSPQDRAKLTLNLLVPKNSISVASGILLDTTTRNNTTKYTWIQEYETPAYTYGFTIGSFTQYEETHEDKRLKYYANNYTKYEMATLFQYTGKMISFFEEKSGMPLPQKTYSQVLIGNHYQEMSGFAILKRTYGALILKDSTETNLISHELAHQWWGNMITCKSWNHFWLNEGFATFMSAAFNEHQFGTTKYESDIDSYYKVYQEVKSRRGDKPLVFKNWSNPSSDDRNLVYFKGAYVLHLLKKELGEQAFWNGIKVYTQTHYGRSVTTKDFQVAMEEATEASLEAFFDEWIY